MKVGNEYYRTIWKKESSEDVICVIDQRFLPHEFVVEELKSVEDVVVAIRDMHVRGAGLIGAAAGYGMYLAALEAKHKNSFDEHINHCADRLVKTRPTAVNLEWAVKRQLNEIKSIDGVEDKIMAAKAMAALIVEDDAEHSRNIGVHGVKLIEEISKKKNGGTVNILTHCNAGWLAFVDYGTATAPIYKAFELGIDVHVWVDETRPRNQGASLTAWELLNQGVSHTVIADNTGGHLMQHKMVDLVITGADRVTRAGDAANKIGTYLKALAAKDNNIPFYVALPSSTLDYNIRDGLKEIEIEERSGEEVQYITGMTKDGLQTVMVTPYGSKAVNYGFDVTPARLITGLITERGICNANEESILKMFPEC